MANLIQKKKFSLLRLPLTDLHVPVTIDMSSYGLYSLVLLLKCSVPDQGVLVSVPHRRQRPNGQTAER